MGAGGILALLMLEFQALGGLGGQLVQGSVWAGGSREGRGAVGPSCQCSLRARMGPAGTVLPTSMHGKRDGDRECPDVLPGAIRGSH